MRMLALETTSQSGSVAVFDGLSLLAQRNLDASRRNAQTLAPGIRDLLAEAGWRPADLELVAVAVGPGSFTGLRVGVTTAKVLAYSVGAAVLGVNTLEAIARQAPPEASPLWTVMDAHRDQVFAARFVRDASGDARCLIPTTIMDLDAWLQAVKPDEWLAGPMLEKLAGRLPTGTRTVPPELWAPSAVGVGRIAAPRAEAGQRDDPWTLVPHYFRASAAEEKLAARQSPAAGGTP